MATWDEIDVDFGGDETGNFGPRLESGTALYQVDTTATISPKGEVNKTFFLIPYYIWNLFQYQDHLCGLRDSYETIDLSSYWEFLHYMIR